MLGRLFGRSKEDNDDTVCSVCGRTLLAGEWTQRLVDDDGAERYVCSLCARPADNQSAVTDAPAVQVATVGNGNIKPAKADSDAFWRALKDKDAEISRLESLLARSEAEKQELAAQLARERGERESAIASGRADDPVGTAAVSIAAVSETAGEWVETNDAGGEAVVAEPQSMAPEAESTGEAERWSDAGDDTMAIPPEELPDAEPVAGSPAPLVSASDEELQAAVRPAAGPAPIERTDPRLGEALRGAAVAVGPAAGAAPFVAPPAPAFGPEPSEADDELIPLTILQRGVDLLNVSAVPRRIVETNESLGMPQVHVGAEGQSTLLVTFMWTMGWYRFRVELADAGRITLADRGYDERTDLRPNASVRSDGTVQLAPTQMKPPTPKDTSDVKPAGVTSGVIISKSLMGQRTDDENVPADWKTQRAPDFDWGR